MSKMRHTVGSRVRTAALHTVGCKLNQFETNDMERQFVEAGWSIVPFGEPADVVVVNTCTVTARSDHRCRAALRRARRAAPGGTIVAAGCYAAAQPEAVGALPEVDLVLGNEGKSDVLARLRDREGPPGGAGPDATRAPAPFRPIRAFAGHTRAFVKIQDGCDERCSYCIVPLARGPSRSLGPREAAAQVVALAASGYREVVLTGVHLGSWGRDLGRPSTLAALLRRLAAIPGIERLRLSSIEPTEIDGELVGTIAGSERICPHLHVPLQSGSARVLRAMGRPYGPGEYAAVVSRLADALPEPGIGADVIAGFPGETEEDVADTLALLERLPLTYLHVFPFSPRPGTDAAGLPRQVPREERDRRAEAIRALGRAKAQAFRARYVGRTVRALVEGRPGRATEALTGNYLKVRLDAREGDVGALRDVRVTGLAGGRLVGEIAR